MLKFDLCIKVVALIKIMTVFTHLLQSLNVITVTSKPKNVNGCLKCLRQIKSLIWQKVMLVETNDVSFLSFSQSFGKLAFEKVFGFWIFCQSCVIFPGDSFCRGCEVVATVTPNNRMKNLEKTTQKKIGI